MFNRTQYPQGQDIWAANKEISIAQKKSKMDEEEVEDSSPSKKSQYLTEVASQDQFSDQNSID